MRIAYFYFIKDEPDPVRATAAKHRAYWASKKLDGYMGGPFGDRSGGFITFQTPDVATALDLIDNDPFVTADLLVSSWIKEWQAD
jgi:uncharacterized protein YciI